MKTFLLKYKFLLLSLFFLGIYFFNPGIENQNKSSIKDNVKIGQDSIVAGASKVFNNFPKNSRIGGSPAMDINSWKRLIVAQRLNYIKRKKN